MFCRLKRQLFVLRLIVSCNLNGQTFMRILLCLLLIASFSSVARNQCAAPEYRQFDFWLGHWNVSIESDNVIRTNRISLINNGCTLLEEYTLSLIHI